MTTGTTIDASAADSLVLGGDLTVNRMGFGAMRLTGPGILGEPTDREEAKAVLRRAVELNVNFIDTADSYGPEVSERLIAETLYPYPEGLIIATKGGLIRHGPGPWPPNGRPDHLRRALEGSLRRLRLERIDLYQFHRPDPDVPIQESIGALVDMQGEGKIRHVGVSNFNLDQLALARTIARIASVQNRYNLTERASEDVLKECERSGLAFLPWGPLAEGTIGASTAQLEEIAQHHGATTTQISLAWLLAHSPAMLVIPGTSKVKHLDENVAASGIQLTDEEIADLDDLSESNR
jgi:pyridoxine 4-dehydrogenase